MLLLVTSLEEWQLVADENEDFQNNSTFSKERNTTCGEFLCIYLFNIFNNILLTKEEKVKMIFMFLQVKKKRKEKHLCTYLQCVCMCIYVMCHIVGLKLRGWFRQGKKSPQQGLRDYLHIATCPWVSKKRKIGFMSLPFIVLDTITPIECFGRQGEIAPSSYIITPSEWIIDPNWSLMTFGFIQELNNLESNLSKHVKFIL